ncbi:MAG: tRNA 2-thiouridine(34) synthase MnmA [Proteobacteria bacterium]|nr:tRNA 2-thiouridine(34) synthase MnmA [Pseudomonadota bacterium]
MTSLSSSSSSLLSSLPDPHSSHVVVAMSGGVDSSVCALLLKEQGYRVSGLFARCWQEPDDVSSCSTYEQDYQDVAYTCSLLDIPFHTVDLSKEYRTYVFDDFVAGYKKGLTPNPDILCNRYIKFDHLYQHAQCLGADLFATGHYCRSDGISLYKAKDCSKDQSYFLYSIRPQVLPHVLFPLGDLHKSEVRLIAKKYGLPSHNKKDSTGLCFIGKRKFRDFLGNFIEKKPGKFCTLDETCVGTHQGAHFYTPGQRRYLGLGGEGERWYVVKKDMQNNVVYVMRGDHPQMLKKDIIVTDIRWLCHDFEWPLQCMVKVRHLGVDIPCSLTAVPSEESMTNHHNTVALSFSSPQKGLACGQSAVFYHKDQCIGGGIMEYLEDSSSQ